ncbi:zinc finger protein 1 [Elysia marginata]|uniref:Zinc finger protein 1 n=1 Tax=Elysia marginata TaxID=1093978 RepID=A0AAV4HMI2_9GAST|nr:zinc finger protein 1 [Elysia marginata]
MYQHRGFVGGKGRQLQSSEAYGATTSTDTVSHSQWGLLSSSSGNISGNSQLTENAMQGVQVASSMISPQQPYSYNAAPGDSNKPFACHICGSGFLTRTGFILHMKSHEGRKFICCLCDAKFFQKAHLKGHLKKIHKMAQCATCLELFSLGNSYNQHVLHCPAVPGAMKFSL